MTAVKVTRTVRGAVVMVVKRRKSGRGRRRKRAVTKREESTSSENKMLDVNNVSKRSSAYMGSLTPGVDSRFRVSGV